MKNELINALVEDLKDIYQRIVQFMRAIPFPKSNIRRPLFLLTIGLALSPLLLFFLLLGLSEISILASEIFYINSLLFFLIIQCLMVLVATNPIYALLLLICVFFSTAILLLSIQVQFLALIYLIIYVGAIAILFLFVLMMFNIKLKKINPDESIISFLVTFFIYNMISSRFVYLVLTSMQDYLDYNLYFAEYSPIKINDIRYILTYSYSDIFIFSNLLYTYYGFLFLLSGLLLFVSMIGSIILALSTTEINIFTIVKK